jgi:hypothetical protein
LPNGRNNPFGGFFLVLEIFPVLVVVLIAAGMALLRISV